MATKTTKSTKTTSSSKKSTRARSAKPKTSAAANPSMRVTKPAAKTAEQPAVSTTPVTQADPKPIEAKAEKSPAFRRPNLIDNVAERTDIKRRDIKAVLDLVLDELGQALERGEDIVVPPLGRMKVTRTNESEKASIYITKIRRTRGAASDGSSGVEAETKDA